MPNENTKLAKLDAVEAVARKAKDAAVGQANVIESVKVNGTALEVTGKAVNVTVPTKVSDIANDAGYQTGAQVATAIQTALSKTGHASFQVVPSVPSVSAAQENILYLVMNAESGYYDIYAKIGTNVVRLDDVSIDLSGYVQKEAGKGLSTNDYTTPEKEKLASMTVATDEEVAAMIQRVFG